MKPATPLPWRESRLDWRAIEEASSDPLVIADIRGERDDAAYIVQAVNAYPRLVEALREVLAPEGWPKRTAENLLRELGELK